MFKVLKRKKKSTKNILFFKSAQSEREMKAFNAKQKSRKFVTPIFACKKKAES